jgi:hypothetical protein
MKVIQEKKKGRLTRCIVSEKKLQRYMLKQGEWKEIQAEEKIKTQRTNEGQF